MKKIFKTIAKGILSFIFKRYLNTFDSFNILMVVFTLIGTKTYRYWYLYLIEIFIMLIISSLGEKLYRKVSGK